ncbi:MAG: CNNM domain-containing protein [Victivallaceae bacterium]|nr:CNNM domain-containing protein [Victivallaceae bacterium]
MMLIITIIIILLLNSFFAGIEIGLISMARPRLRHAAARGSTSAKLLERMTTKPQLMLAITLLGNNICTALASILADQLFAGFGFSATNALICSTLIMTILLMLSEIIPKNWFRQSPEERCIAFAPLYFFFGVILWPGAKVLSWLTIVALKLFSSSTDNDAKNTRNLLRRDFRFLLRDSKSAGSLDSGEADILEKSLNFNSQHIRDIYTPLEKLTTIAFDETISAAIVICRHSGKSRLPIIKNGEWKGFFSIYDAIYRIADSEWDTLTVHECMRTTETISLNAPIADALKLTRRNQIRMLFVSDPAGQNIGVITPTDVARILFNQH